MKNFLKQFGKAICYFLLFLGMQFVVSFGFMFIYGIKVGLEMAMQAGADQAAQDMGIATEQAAFDAQAVAQGSADFMMQNLNWISMIAGCLTILALWIFFLIRRKKLLVETNVTKMSVKYVPMMIVLGLTVSTTVSFGLSLLPESLLEAYAEQSSMMLGASSVVMVIANMIVAPIVEEVIFRGLILSRLQKAVPLAWAVVISSLLFGIAHGQIVWIIYAFVLGVILSAVVVKTESLTASILLHMSFNVFGTVVPTVFGDITSTTVSAIIAIVGAVTSAVLLVAMLKGKKPEKDALQPI